jgi:hypothetical protein
MDEPTRKQFAMSRPEPGAERWSLGTIALVVVLFGILAASLWYAAQAWMSVEGPPMPPSGYIFMTLGVVLSLLIGFALMGLVFYSARHGYDEQSIDQQPEVFTARRDGRD